MQKTRLLFTAACLLGVTAWGALRARPSSSAASSKHPAAQPPLSAASVAGYRQWTRVNPVPYDVPARIAMQCRTPTPEETAKTETGPHGDKYATVYVNDVGKRAMLRDKTPHFPPGSMVVKAKLTTPQSDTPELLTVMRKRETGYNPANGDWEYLVLDGKATHIQAQGRLHNCQNCHAKWKTTDFVSRFYLPDKFIAHLN